MIDRKAGKITKNAMQIYDTKKKITTCQIIGIYSETFGIPDLTKQPIPGVPGAQLARGYQLNVHSDQLALPC
jgi:hypothetical protein